MSPFEEDSYKMDQYESLDGGHDQYHVPYNSGYVPRGPNPHDSSGYDNRVVDISADSINSAYQGRRSGRGVVNPWGKRLLISGVVLGCLYILFPGSGKPEQKDDYSVHRGSDENGTTTTVVDTSGNEDLVAKKGIDVAHVKLPDTVKKHVDKLPLDKLGDRVKNTLKNGGDEKDVAKDLATGATSEINKALHTNVKVPKHAPTKDDAFHTVKGGKNLINEFVKGKKPWGHEKKHSIETEIAPTSAKGSNEASEAAPISETGLSKIPENELPNQLNPDGDEELSPSAEAEEDLKELENVASDRRKLEILEGDGQHLGGNVGELEKLGIKDEKLTKLGSELDERNLESLELLSDDVIKETSKSLDKLVPYADESVKILSNKTPFQKRGPIMTHDMLARSRSNRGEEARIFDKKWHFAKIFDQSQLDAMALANAQASSLERIPEFNSEESDTVDRTADFSTDPSDPSGESKEETNERVSMPLTSKSRGTTSSEDPAVTHYDPTDQSLPVEDSVTAEGIPYFSDTQLAGICGGQKWKTAQAMIGTDELPILQVVANNYMKADRNFVARVCTDTSGTPCSKPATWKNSKVVLCIDGKFFSMAKVHTRGHVSALLPKHQFSIKMADKFGKPMKKGILGMPPDKKWVLAMSFVDTSFVRNQISFEIYRRLGAWAPRNRYVNLVFQGQDLGLYAVGERISISPHRVHVEKKNPFSALVTVDWPKDGYFSVSTNTTKTSMAILHPTEKQITTQQKEYFQSFLNEVDARVRNHNASIDHLVDLESFARYYILEEIAKDLDGYALSNFLKIENGKLYQAAPWDFDLAYNFVCLPTYWVSMEDKHVYPYNKGWNVKNPRDFAEWMGNDGSPSGGLIDFGRNIRIFFYDLFKHPQFQKAFRSLWLQARAGPVPVCPGSDGEKMQKHKKKAKAAQLAGNNAELQPEADNKTTATEEVPFTEVVKTAEAPVDDEAAETSESATVVDPYAKYDYRTFDLLGEGLAGNLGGSVVDKFALQFPQSAKRDIEIWSQTSNRCVFWECCHPEDGTSAKRSLQHLREYLNDRAAWIDGNIMQEL